MKNTFIKNEHLLTGLSDFDLNTLRTRAELHRRYSNIDIKIISCSPEKLVLSIRQGKPFNGNVFDTKRLVEIGKEFVQGVGVPNTVHVGAQPYNPPPPEAVTPEWIRKKMHEHGLKVKDVSHALGVDSHTISAYKNGLKPLSGVVRAMFYYYFNKNR